MKLLILSLSFAILSSATQAAQKMQVGTQYYMIFNVAAQVVTYLGYQNETYIFRYETGPSAGRMGSAYRSDLFASMRGCAGKGYCVGDRFSVAERRFAQATIVGIEEGGRFVLHFETGDFAGRTGSNWRKEQLFSLQYSQ